MAIKNSITKSRSGHYAASIRDLEFGRLFIARKISSIEKARNILKEANENLLMGSNFGLRHNCIYSVSITSLNKYLARGAK